MWIYYIRGFMKRNIVLIILIFLALALAGQNVSAKDTICLGCHPIYSNVINARSDHDSTCTICHKLGYSTTHIDFEQYIGYNVNESTCNQAACHSPTSGSAQKPVNESHGNHYYGQNKADCTQCHFANTTQIFPLNSSLYVHDHNFTVEYNYYNYNISGIPLSINSGAGKGMFPYYTCTLTCHIQGSATGSLEDEVIGWNQSAHARSLHYPASSDNKNSCAKCKSPPNFNGNSSNTSTITAANWQGIPCRVCHNLHNDTYSDNGSTPIYYAFYNSTATGTGAPVYDKVSNATALCEKCHLTFNDDINSTHNSNYGGSHKTTVGFDCADCHMNSTSSNLTHKFEVKNTTSEVTGCQVCHNYVNSHTNFTQRSYHDNKVDCVACHDQTFTTDEAGDSIYVFLHNSN